MSQSIESYQVQDHQYLYDSDDIEDEMIIKVSIPTIQIKTLSSWSKPRTQNWIYKKNIYPSSVMQYIKSVTTTTTTQAGVSSNK